MSFSKYPAYENSGVEWLGELPTCWSAYDGRRLFGYVRDSASGQAEQLAATQAYGVVPQKWYMEQQGKNVVLALAGTENFKEVHVDDFVISLRSFQGGIEHSAYDGCVSPAYTVLRAIKPMLLLPNFYRYVFKERSYISALQSVTTGIREGRTITYEQFGSIALPVPTCSEQTQIARFLDYETAKIDALIEEQERLIELLKEKRQAVISHAVTKGLDPNAPMKDSGVEWFGEVPAHWAASRVKNIASFITSGPRGWSDYIDESGEDVFLQSGDMDNRLNVLFNKAKRITTPEGAEGIRTRVQDGDVLVCITGANTGRVAVLRELIQVAYVNQHLGLIRPHTLVCDSQYLGYVLSSTSCQTYFSIEQYGLKEGLSLTDLAEAPVMIPPLAEQVKVVNEIERRLSQLDRLSTDAEMTVVLLKERRSALISAAVTGKIDVRDWHPPKSLSYEPHPEDKSCLESI